MHHLSKTNHYIYGSLFGVLTVIHISICCYFKELVSLIDLKWKKKEYLLTLIPFLFLCTSDFLGFFGTTTYLTQLVEHSVADSLELTSPSEQGSTCGSSRWLYYTCQWHSSRLLVNVGFTRDVKLLIVELCLLSCIASMGAHRSLDCIPHQQSVYKRPLWSELAESGIVKRLILDISVGIVPNLVQSTYSNSWLC